MLPKLKKEHFYAQFPHHDKYDDHPDSNLPEWWEEEKFKPNHNSHHVHKTKKIVDKALAKTSHFTNPIQKRILGHRRP